VREPGESRDQARPAQLDFLGVPLLRCDTPTFIKWLLDAAASRREPLPPTFVTYLNAWCFLIASEDPTYAVLLRSADGVYADGQGIVWASRRLEPEAPLPERVNAADFIIDLLKAASARGLSVALLGSEPGVARRAGERFMSAVPGLKLTGCYDGYFSNEGGQPAVLEKLAADQPDLLLVGMGVPLQEKWAWEHRAQLPVGAIWCVGAMFEYFGEARARAPVWIRKAGLEWLFRLVLEPRRLWRRYLVGNARFMWRVLRLRRVP
jgi:N-acetylglucosaminyldiphosphoundecaprenol N-acetyl-beta-D-mannosaminyltransferase